MANKNLGIEDGSISSHIALESPNGLFWFPQKDGSRVYFVVSESISTTDTSIVATAGIPQIGDLVDGAPVRRHRATEVGRVQYGNTPRILWKVTIETDTRFDPSSSSSSEDPTDMRPRRRWYTNKEKRRIEKDVNGDPIQTANGEEILYERSVIKSVLEIERYENYPFDPSVHIDYCNHSNDATFYGAPIGTAIIDDIQSEEEVVSGVTYCKVRYVIVFLILFEDGVPLENTIADVTFLHQGYLVRANATAKPSTVLDKHGHPRKCNLEEDGTETPEGTTPTFVTFPDIPYATFDDLNLYF